MLFAALLVAGTVVVGPGARPTGAAENGEWAVHPASPPGARARRANFQLDVQPGQRVEDAIDVINRSERHIRFRLFTADAYNTPAGGGFALRGVDDPKRDVATWVQLPVEDFVAAPKSTIRVPFAMQVPRDVAPGDHVGGIVALNDTPTVEEAGSVDLAVKRAVGVRMYVRVAGPARPALVVRSLSGVARTPALAPASGTGHATIEYSVENSGNVTLDVKARLRVTDVFGRTVKTFRERSIPGLLPEQHADFTQEWSDLPAFGLRLTPHLELVAAGASTSASTSFLTVPWLIVAAAALYLAHRIRRRFRRRTAPPDPIEEAIPEPVPVG